jgi:hypothetical protein
LVWSAIAGMGVSNWNHNGLLDSEAAAKNRLK